jgi:hypothetical protein
MQPDAVNLTPDDHPVMANYLKRLGDAFQEKHTTTQATDDLRKATSYYRDVL